MLENILTYLSNKKICILGMGREGLSSYEFLRQHFPEKELILADQNEESLSGLNGRKFWGENYLEALDEADIILKAPGVPLKRILKETSKALSNQEITSQVDLFLRFVDVFTIGITGTKGKSTTTSALHHILKKNGKDVILLGNIGDPIFGSINTINPETYVILEMSSFQCEYLQASPDISAIINLYSDHLDHHLDQSDYEQAKLNIFAHGGKLFYGAESPTLVEHLRNTQGVSVKLEETPETIKQHIQIPGQHNLKNITMATAIAEEIGLNTEEIGEAIKTFRGVKYRLELLETSDDLTWYNDGCSVNPSSTLAAVTSLEKIDTLIIGGKSRGVDDADLVKEILNRSDIHNIILLPDYGDEIESKLSGKNLISVETLEEATQTAKEKTPAGGTILFSPGATSFNMFRDMYDRAEQFEKLVR